MKAIAKHIGVVKLIEPLYIVASQLNTLIADGTETVKVSALKMMVVIGPIPAVNMWCPQTRKPKSAIAIEEYAMNRYPKIRLWL
jgi:hypothetical protein